MDPGAVQHFLRRDWQRATASKRMYWAERFHHQGWRAVWNAGQDLLAYARRVRPDFPTPRDRELDLAHHVTLQARLDATARAFARR